ncbi:MAG: arsenate reductase (glutaredoxin) [Myxococcales bacterium FL481]|nr:MAG: arsenate reductase (glutaredoxin) [Myxococcales bacterium FL481]
MLDDHGIGYRYREYTRDPLNRTELRRLFAALGKTPHDLLRRNDRAFKELQLTGEETQAELIGHMASHPTLLQRPIGVLDGRAVVGRPVENLLTLVD